MLKLSTKTRYGLRAMIELALAPTDQPLEMSAIAQRQHLSRKYLHSLLSALKDAGLTESIRGVRGGYRLSRPAETIRISEIVAVLEGTVAIVDCIDDSIFCEHRGNCRAAPLWHRLNRAIEEVLCNTTLADLAKQDPSCTRLETKKRELND